MGQVLKFPIDFNRRSICSEMPRTDSTAQPRSSTALAQDWLSLAGKLQRLALLAPVMVKSLELVVDEMLKQLPP